MMTPVVQGFVRRKNVAPKSMSPAGNRREGDSVMLFTGSEEGNNLRPTTNELHLEANDLLLQHLRYHI